MKSSRTRALPSCMPSFRSKARPKISPVFVVRETSAADPRELPADLNEQAGLLTHAFVFSLLRAASPARAQGRRRRPRRAPFLGRLTLSQRPLSPLLPCPPLMSSNPSPQPNPGQPPVVVPSKKSKASKAVRRPLRKTPNGEVTD